MSETKEEKILNDFLDSIHSYKWNEAVNILSEITLMLCKSNVENVERVVLESVDDDLSIKIYVKEDS